MAIHDPVNKDLLDAIHASVGNDGQHALDISLYRLLHQTTVLVAAKALRLIGPCFRFTTGTTAPSADSHTNISDSGFHRSLDEQAARYASRSRPFTFDYPLEPGHKDLSYAGFLDCIRLSFDMVASLQRLPKLRWHLAHSTDAIDGEYTSQECDLFQVASTWFSRSTALASAANSGGIAEGGIDGKTPAYTLSHLMELELTILNTKQYIGKRVARSRLTKKQEKSDMICNKYRTGRSSLMANRFVLCPFLSAELQVKILSKSGSLRTRCIRILTV
ncbi:hypothetical protein WAI453_004687 [Rhynchosporium graminicola]